MDLRREKLKLEIDNNSYNLIGSIETTQRSLINLSKSKLASANIEKVKEVMKGLIRKFDTLEFNDEKLKNLKKSFFDINLKLQRTTDNFNISLLGKKEYIFKYEKVLMESILGELYGILRTNLSCITIYY